MIDRDALIKAVGDRLPQTWCGTAPDRMVTETLPVIVGVVTDELRPFAQGKAIWAHALGSDAERGWLDLIHMLDAIDQAAGRETTA